MSSRNLALLARSGGLEPPPDPAPQRDNVADQQDLIQHYLSQPQKEKTPEPPNMTSDTSKRGQNNMTSDASKRGQGNMTSDASKEVPNTTSDGSKPRPDFTDDVPDITEEVEQIFAGMKLEVQSLDETAIIEIDAEISAAGGVVVAAGAGGSYVLVPVDFDPKDLINKAAEPVTVFWVKDCLSSGELVPLQYYHRPLGVRAPCLRGVVASLSTYCGLERAFLDELATLLGATTQLRFCRRNTANALASTHLICPAPCGDKYLGCVKWGLPAVTKDWLLACAKEGRRVSEGPFLVGDTKAPEREETEISKQPNQPDQREQPEPPVTMAAPAEPVAPRRCSVPNRDDTPKGKLHQEGEELSPASRYIAMARQGLLGGESQPHQSSPTAKVNDPGSGPVTPSLQEALSTPNLMTLSPTTRRRVMAIKRGEMPSDPVKTPNDPFASKIPTPDSAFGAALGPLSPHSRKRLWTLVQELPAPQEPLKEHTPLSEIRNRYLAQFNNSPNPPLANVAPRKLLLHDQPDTPPAKIAKTSENQSVGAAILNSSDRKDNTENVESASSTKSTSKLPAAVDAQLNRLSAALSGLTSQRTRRSNRDSLSRLAAPTLPPEPDVVVGPESQPYTVGWDDSTPTPQPTSGPTPEPDLPKRFMLSSNVDNREETIRMLQDLGCTVCDGSELDPEATHLLCAVPGRSEKMLGSIAAGKWVLHPAYVTRSRAEGKLLKEEEFEWGNPLATILPSLTGGEKVLAAAAYRWRSARAEGRNGPFHGMVALLHVPAARRRLLARLIIAGGGEAPDDEPPYNNESVTVCFADAKRCPLSPRDSAWLVSRAIPVCAPVLLSSFLTDDPPPDPKLECLPEFKPT